MRETDKERESQKERRTDRQTENCSKDSVQTPPFTPVLADRDQFNSNRSNLFSTSVLCPSPLTYVYKKS